MLDQLIIFDTTLRDGEQSPGATMNLQEKMRLARQLEFLGVDVIEAGFPASSDGDFAAVKAISQLVQNCEVAALCRASVNDIDRAWQALQEARHPRIHIFIAASDLHIKHKLNMSREEVLKSTYKTVSHGANYTENIEFSAEDASRADPGFLIELFLTAVKAGAKTINIADTVGYSQPEEFASLIRTIRKALPTHIILGAHCHNDLGLGVANSLAAIQAGVRQIEATLCGIGERAGNAALEEIVMALNLRQDIYKVKNNVKTQQIFPSCRLLSMIIGRPIPANKAIVGANAFAHESGIHQDGMLKHPGTYEIMTPQSIGRGSSDMIIGKHSGRNAVGTRLQELGYHLNNVQLKTVFDAVKKLADKKEIVHDEDLEALVLSEIYRIPDRYRLSDLSVQTSAGDLPAVAAISLEDNTEDNKQILRHVGFGAGPVDATFKVISSMVGRKTELEQFNINAITGGTDALGEVTVRLREGKKLSIGRGSDGDIIVASAKAFIDALNRLDKKEQENLKQE